MTLLIGAIGFRTVAAPALVRFPLNVDQTVTYTGTALTVATEPVTTSVAAGRNPEGK